MQLAESRPLAPLSPAASALPRRTRPHAISISKVSQTMQGLPTEMMPCEIRGYHMIYPSPPTSDGIPSSIVCCCPSTRTSQNSKALRTPCPPASPRPRVPVQRDTNRAHPSIRTIPSLLLRPILVLTRIDRTICPVAVAATARISTR